MFASTPKPKQFIHTFKRSTTIVSHQTYLNCHISSSIQISSRAYKNTKHALCFSSSSTSAWDKMFHQLSSEQTSTIAQKSKISMRDKILASHSENEELILLNHTTDSRLKNWIMQQRKYYKKQNKSAGKYITNSQIKLLNDMNFIWDVKKYMWHIRLNELKEFQRKYGHSIVSCTYQYFPKLSSWVKVIRKRKYLEQRDKSLYPNTIPLTNTQIAQLDELHFEWDPLDSMWLETFHKLQDFYKIYGHTQVTRSKKYTNTALAMWIWEQRSNYKKYQNNKINDSNNNVLGSRGGGMTEKKRKLLESIGFIWDVPAWEVLWEVYDSMWLEKFYELQDFYKMYGHTRVKRSYTNASLAIWVQHQRSNFKKYQINKINDSNNNGCNSSERGGGMTEKKIELLESMGFIWDVRQSSSANLDKIGIYKLNN